MFLWLVLSSGEINKVTKKKSKKEKLDINESVMRNISFLRIFVLSLAIILLVGLIMGWVVEFVYAGRVAYGLKLGEVELGGMNKSELELFMEGKREEVGGGLKFTGENLDQDTVFEMSQMGIWVNIDKCEEEIWEYGRYEGYWSSMVSRIRSLLGKKDMICQVDFDQVDYNNWLNGLREQVNEPAVSASIEKQDNDLKLIESREGLVVDEEKLQADLEASLSILDFHIIKLDQIIDLPQITNEMADSTLNLARSELGNEMKWIYGDWVIDVLRDDIYEMLFFESRAVEDCANPELFISGKDNQVIYLGYDFAAVDKFLNDNAWMFEDRPVDAKLAMSEDGPVVVQEGTTGKLVNRIELIKYLDGELGQNKGDVALPVEVMESVISTDNIDELGIKELIATGWSDFSYSPANRIHNISVGADKFDGMVIAPGEEFSFTTLLGSVDAASGYLPELVIAGNETRPEYGGGLCQVSTTMYRTALDAGFPITARSPHRYRVSYYEPAGQDATVYIPNPDLRFINDTKNYVLIEAVMGDYILTFNFYGTSDGRQVEVTDPVIYNITSPPAPEYIYTSSLPAGQKIQVDSAHYGADSIFYRYITYANGETKEEEIFSRYQAWPAKYKVGEVEVEENTDEDSGLVDDDDAGLPDVDGEEDLSGTV